MIQYTKLFLLCIVACMNFVREVESSEALVFNFVTQQLARPTEKKNNEGVLQYNGTSCIFACPAASNDEKQNLINKERSITGYGTFSKYIYEKEVFLRTTKICTEPIKPTTVFNKSTNSIETGYELFYKDDTIPLLNYKEYGQLTKVYEEETNKEETLNNTYQVERTEDDGNTKFHIVNLDSKWVYYWISVLSIKGSEASRQITFTKDYISDNSKLPNKFFEVCEVITLGDETKNMTSRDKIERLLELANKTSSSENPLRITQIMPMHYFHTLSARLATCSELNLALVWDSIATIPYKKVDAFLYALYRAWPSKVNIIFGVNGTTKEYFNNQTDTSILKNYTLPVAEILYRIVEYREDDLTLNVIIVIHNNKKSVNERICDFKDEVSGWDDMKVTNRKFAYGSMGRVYACPVTENAIKKLQANYELTKSMRPFVLDEDKRIKITANGAAVCAKETWVTHGATKYYTKDYL